MYQFATLDPRNIPAAAAANDKVFANQPVLGIEVTVPQLAARCELGNIDPQHSSGGDANRAAIEVAVGYKLPADGFILATIRADLDSVGAMAVLSLRKTGVSLSPAVRERIALVAESDKFVRGGWPGVQPLPTAENPWPGGSEELAAIAAAVMDFKISLFDRVTTMEWWLLTGDEPAQYRDSVEKERLDLITALESGAIKHETRAGGRIAVVESTHRAATSVGYSLAPVVVALNPEFRFKGGEPHKKFTICTFEPKFADIKSALVELATLEAGWGGSPTIGGSPQGASSALTIDQVVAVVEKHLR